MLNKLYRGWKLMWDRRVPLSTKLVPLLALLYIISPIDLIPDALPLLGITDDLGLFLLSLEYLIRRADAADHHRQDDPPKIVYMD